tara:strand:+ start:146 stop:346 length:201 start_codon:yes stop_codon:yes gene_type:complete
MISTKVKGISLVPNNVINSVIPTEYGVNAIKKEKSTSDVVMSEIKRKLLTSNFFKIMKNIENKIKY